MMIALLLSKSMVKIIAFFELQKAGRIYILIRPGHGMYIVLETCLETSRRCLSAVKQLAFSMDHR